MSEKPDLPPNAKASSKLINPKDEFYGGIWWRRNELGAETPGLEIRPATGHECADEIRRLRSENEIVHQQLDAGGVPREFNGNDLTLWGRINLFKSRDPTRIPHHQRQPGDVLRWQCPVYPANLHRWRIRSVCLGGAGQESLIEMESLTHSPGIGAEWNIPLPIVAVPEVLVRHLRIEDVGDQFGVPSSRQGAK